MDQSLMWDEMQRQDGARAKLNKSQIVVMAE